MQTPLCSGNGMFAAVCASHSPLIHDGPAPVGTRQGVRDGFASLANVVEAFQPDLVVEFAPDHFNGFNYGLMPAFCLGAAAQSVGDWQTCLGELPVSKEAAAALTAYLIEKQFDVAISHAMRVDHGFTQIWQEMCGGFDRFPIIPIFINCAAPPLPTPRRARALGTAVGQWARDCGKRVLFVGSGGLSHDPPLPNLQTALPEVRERLIGSREATAAELIEHRARVIAAGEAAGAGLGPCQPVNPQWDGQVITLLADGDLDRFDEWSLEDIRRLGGRGGSEILCWIAAFAALSAVGPYRATLHYYAAIEGWIVGMAMMSAVQSESLDD